MGGKNKKCFAVWGALTQVIKSLSTHTHLLIPLQKMPISNFPWFSRSETHNQFEGGDYEEKN